MEWDITDRRTRSRLDLILTGWWRECGLTTHRVMAERIPTTNSSSSEPEPLRVRKEADAYPGGIKDFVQRVIARNKKMY
jgi:hypothetical protein